MELVENGTLKDLLHGTAEQPAMLVTWADPLLRVAIDCVEGLRYLHDLSYIHRDLKPENVLMTRTFTGKLADLGETRAIDLNDTMTQVDPSTHTLAACGAPLYLIGWSFSNGLRSAKMS